MKVSLLVLALLGGLWSARSLVGDADRWEAADARHATFYADGSPRSQATLVEGCREGPARTWHPGGARASEGAYSDDERQGAWRFWHPGGELDQARSGLYERGARVAPLPPG